MFTPEQLIDMGITAFGMTDNTCGGADSCFSFGRYKGHIWCCCFLCKSKVLEREMTVGVLVIQIRRRYNSRQLKVKKCGGVAFTQESEKMKKR